MFSVLKQLAYGTGATIISNIEYSRAQGHWEHMEDIRYYSDLASKILLTKPWCLYF